MFYFSGVYTVPELSNPDSNKHPIGNVELDGSSLVPIIGEAPKFLTAPENAPYIIKNQVWSVVTGPDTSRAMNEGELFEADNDHQFGYDYTLNLQPKEGYYFTGDCTLTVTGVNWDYSGYDLYTPILSFSGCCSAKEAKTDPVKQVIGSVSLDGSSIIPVANEAPKLLSVPNDANYSIVSQSWLQVGYTYDNPATTLEAGKTYFYYVRLDAKEGYEFADDADLTVSGIAWPSEEEARKLEDNCHSRHGIVTNNGKKQLEFGWVYKLAEAVNYEIIDGSNQTVNVNDGKDASFRSNAEISKFVEVQVDSAVVAPQNYTVTEGSTIVTFKADYLKSLSTGKHTVTIVSKDGKASTDFTVTKTQNNTSGKTETGDMSNIVLWFFLICVSALGFVICAWKMKKVYSK